jgi:hypothetical protein
MPRQPTAAPPKTLVCYEAEVTEHRQHPASTSPHRRKPGRSSETCAAVRRPVLKPIVPGRRFLPMPWALFAAALFGIDAYGRVALSCLLQAAIGEYPLQVDRRWRASRRSRHYPFRGIALTPQQHDVVIAPHRFTELDRKGRVMCTDQLVHGVREITLPVA